MDVNSPIIRAVEDSEYSHIGMELANNPSGLLATEIKNLAMSAVAGNDK